MITYSSVKLASNLERFAIHLMTAQVLIYVAIPLKWKEIGRCPPLILHTGGARGMIVGGEWGGGGGGDSGWRGAKSQHDHRCYVSQCVQGSMAYCGFKHGRMGATWNTGKEHA